MYARSIAAVASRLTASATRATGVAARRSSRSAAGAALQAAGHAALRPCSGSHATERPMAAAAGRAPTAHVEFASGAAQACRHEQSGGGRGTDGFVQLLHHLLAMASTITKVTMQQQAASPAEQLKPWLISVPLPHGLG